MAARDVQDQLCRFFGGPYDAETRTYRTPQIPGLGVVRRAFAADDNHDDYTLGAVVDQGCMMVIQLSHGEERRVAVAGPVSGVKRAAYVAELHCFITSISEFAEDAYDFAVDLREAIVERVHGDRTCGSGGFEAGGFQVGEGDGPRFEWDLFPADTKAGETKIYLRMAFDVLEYIQA